MPTFDEILTQVLARIDREGGVASRVLKRPCALDDEYLEDIKADLIDAKRVAADEDSKVLVWLGKGSLGASAQGPKAKPILYTPSHLAERILVEQAALEARGATDGERKTITALFADIKGSMDLIEDLDPEEARSLIDPALQLMM